MKALRNLILLAAPLTLVATAQALTIDFEDLAQNNAIANDVASPYVSQGFQFVSEAPFHVWGNQSSFYPGSTALWAGGSDSISLTQLNGAAFTLNSIDLAGVSLSGVQDIEFVGTYSDSSQDVEIFHLGNPGTLQTFTFANMTNVVIVFWGQAVPYHQFDNVNVTPSPEPASLALLGLGIVGLMVRRRRKA